jgi:hypothetical protein
MASDGMIHIPSFIMISSGILVILRLLPQIFAVQCWYYYWEGFMKYTTEMASDGATSFMTICSGIQVILELLPQQF